MLRASSPRRRRPADRRARARRRSRVRLAVAAPVPARGAARPRPGPAGDRRRRRRPRGPRPRRGLRAWLEPRTVRYYPSRGVTYESHLAPPPHLVGLRIAALDALLEQPSDDERAGRRRQRRRAVGEGPRSRAAAARLRAAKPGSCSTSTRPRCDLVAAGYERVDQVEDRGQFAIRGGLLDVFPATEDRAVRVDLFGDEIESLRWFSTFTQRSLGDADWSRSRRRPSSPRSTASWPRSPRSRTRPTAPTSPSCCRSRTSTRSSSSLRTTRRS